MAKLSSVSGFKRGPVVGLLLAACCVLLSGFLSTALAEDSSFRIIHPSDEEHRLLPKTCTVCHKDELPFFIVTAKDRAGLEKAMQRLITGTNKAVAALPGRSSAEAKVNPHTKTSCYFCHSSQPEKGSDPAELQYRSVTGGFVELADTEQTCQLCHPEIMDNHKRILKNKRKAQTGLVRAGLPTPGKKVLCITCHDMHTETAVVNSLRTGFFEFARTSAVLFPHAQSASCMACHPKKLLPGDRAVFIEKSNISLCTRCHGNEHDRHIVGTIGSVETYPMDFLAFPLGKDGALECSTCHDEPCANQVDLEKNETMLRGGPYYRMTNFCEKCHPTAGPGKVNPHKQIDKKGNVMEGSCSFCHITDPDEGEYGPGDMNYIESRTELCTLCHEPKPHPSVLHVTEAVEGKRLDGMRKYERRHEVFLPLDDENRMECTTCHNAHDKGVLGGMEALGAGEFKQLRIPSFAELCTPCHARYD